MPGKAENGPSCATVAMLARQSKSACPGGQLIISRVSPPPLRQRLTGSLVWENAASPSCCRLRQLAQYLQKISGNGLLLRMLPIDNAGGPANIHIANLPGVAGK